MATLNARALTYRVGLIWDGLVATPRRRLALWSLNVWLITRALDVAVTLASLTGPVGARFQRWYFDDALQYVGIAQGGYSNLRHAAYWPLYPLLVNGLLRIGLPWQVAALAISNGAYLAAAILCGWLVWRETRQERVAMWAVAALAVSPLALFLGAMYADSLFVALVASVWLAARSGQWRWAGVALGLAVVTRPFGVALALALAVAWARQRRPWREALWLVGPSALTIGAFLAMLWRVYGDLWAPFVAESRLFGHAFRWPWQTLVVATRQLVAAAAATTWGWTQAHMLLDDTLLALCLLVALLMVRRWPVSFTLYTLAVVALCLVSPVLFAQGQYALISDGRYCYAAAPLLQLPLGGLLARWRWPLSVVVCALSLGTQLALTAFVLRGGWLV